MRRSFTVLAPVAAGALVLATALAYPASSVHGSSLTGPEVPRSIAAVRLSGAYRARWADDDRVIVLRVRDGRRCAPSVLRRWSTGPARLEVRIDRPTGPACVSRTRWWDLRLVPPPIRSRTQTVALFVNGAVTFLNPPRS